MKRPFPKVTTAQLKSVAAASRAKVQLAQSAQRVEHERQEGHRAFASWERHFAAQLAWQRRYGHWLARVLLLPLVVLTVGVVVAVYAGALSGEIRVISKFSGDVVARGDSPFQFWSAVLYHGAVAVFLLWLTYRCVRASRLWSRSAN